MKIVLIDPQGFTFGLNTGLGYLCSSLKKNGFDDVHVLDFNNMPGDEDKRLEKVKDANIVGISIKTFTLKSAVELAKKVKMINPKALIVAGGAHIIIDAENFLAENMCFDVCVPGEGEYAILKLADGTSYDKIPGLYYRKELGVERSVKAGSFIHDLDKLAFPDYSCFDSVTENSIDDYPLVTSRGCPYQCVYCSVRNVMGMAWRFRSPKNIIDELKEAKKIYGFRKFKILDDNFSLDIKRTKEFCRTLIDENLDLKWSCPNGLRADKLDAELLSLMKTSGCYSITIGVESLDEDVFSEINKGERLSEVVAAAQMIKKAGIRLEGFFIVGLPGSTYNIDMETVKKAKRLGFDSMSWNLLVPYPGTAVWKWVEENDGKMVRVLRDWKEGFHIGFNPKPVFETTDYTEKERIKAYRNAYLKSLKLRDIPKMLRILVKRA